MDGRSTGWCTIQELPGHHPRKPGDILLIAKKRMADVEPFAVVVLMREERAASLEAGFQQPSGVFPRRPISEQVKKNITTIAPRCFKQGTINQNALSYLMSWCQGDWPRLQRPVSYVHLQRRCQLSFQPDPQPPNWTPPNRLKHVDLACDEGLEDEDSDNDAQNQEVLLGVMAES